MAESPVRSYGSSVSPIFAASPMSPLVQGLQVTSQYAQNATARSDRRSRHAAPSRVSDAAETASNLHAQNAGRKGREFGFLPTTIAPQRPETPQNNRDLGMANQSLTTFGGQLLRPNSAAGAGAERSTLQATPPTSPERAAGVLRRNVYGSPGSDESWSVGRTTPAIRITPKSPTISPVTAILTADELPDAAPQAQQEDSSAAFSLLSRLRSPYSGHF